MKEIILLLAMQFSQDFGRPIDNVQFRTGDLNHFAVINKKSHQYEITFDEVLVEKLTHEQLKTLVYHMTAKATGMDTVQTKGHFMNPKCILRPYKRLNH